MKLATLWVSGLILTACQTMDEAVRIDWPTGAATITPPTELHAHHNRGGARMVSLVIQDEALHYYTRTPGFSWD